LNKIAASSISSLVLLAIFYFLRPIAFEQAIYNFPNISLENSLVYILIVNLIIFIFTQSQSSKIREHRDNLSLLYGGLIGSSTLSIIILCFYFLNLGLLFQILNISFVTKIYLAFGPDTYISLILFAYLIVFGSTLFTHQHRSALKAEPSIQLNIQNESAKKKIFISELKLLFLSKNLDIHELEVIGGVFILAADKSSEYKSAIKKIHEIVVASGIRIPSNLSGKLNEFLS